MATYLPKQKCRFATYITLLAIGWLGFSLFAGEISIGSNETTNALFVTYDVNDNSVYFGGGNVPSVDPQKLTEARTNRESLPDQYFLEGNWGTLTRGIEVSLRFDKPLYQGSEPINATVLVRNVVKTNLSFAMTLYGNNKVTRDIVDYHVYTPSGENVPSKPKNHGLYMPSSIGCSVFGGTQRKFTERLNDTFDLAPGRYFVEASVSGYRVTVTNDALSKIGEIYLPTNGLTVVMFTATSAKVPITVR